MALNYAYAILGTAVITGGMVMDEEVLVLYCFVLFVAMAYHYLSTMVDESIRGEASKMGKEFDAFFEIQKNY
jgi:4-hydroxybenzoate polyprenyltransferase